MTSKRAARKDRVREALLRRRRKVAKHRWHKLIAADGEIIAIVGGHPGGTP